MLNSLKKNGNQIISEVPNFSTMCRRINNLNLKITDHRNNKTESIAVAVDSTGINIYNMSDWYKRLTAKDRKHKGLEQYRKLQLILREIYIKLPMDKMLKKY